MALQSSLVTAKGSGTVKGYEVPNSTKLNADSFELDDKTKDYYEAVRKNYVNINSHFQKLSELYNSCQKTSVKGTSLKKSIKTLATNCKNQGKYCMDRKKQLEDLFDYAQDKKDFEDFKARFDEYIKTGK